MRIQPAARSRVLGKVGPSPDSQTMATLPSLSWAMQEYPEASGWMTAPWDQVAPWSALR